MRSFYRNVPRLDFTVSIQITRDDTSYQIILEITPVHGNFCRPDPSLTTTSDCTLLSLLNPACSMLNMINTTQDIHVSRLILFNIPPSDSYYANLGIVLHAFNLDRHHSSNFFAAYTAS